MLPDLALLLLSKRLSETVFARYNEIKDSQKSNRKYLIKLLWQKKLWCFQKLFGYIMCLLSMGPLQTTPAARWISLQSAYSTL